MTNPVSYTHLGAINVDYKTRTVEIEGITLKEGDFISLNGTTGEVYKGKVETKAAEVSGDFAALMDLCNKYTLSLIHISFVPSFRMCL